MEFIGGGAVAKNIWRRSSGVLRLGLRLHCLGQYSQLGFLSARFDEQTSEARRTLAAPSREHVNPSAVANAYAKLSRALSATARVPAAVNNYVALIDSRFSLGFPPGTFVRTASANQETPEASAAPSSGDQVAQTGALPPQKSRSPRTRTLGGGTEVSRVVAERRGEAADDLREAFRQTFDTDARLRLCRRRLAERAGPCCIGTL